MAGNLIGNDRTFGGLDRNSSLAAQQHKKTGGNYLFVSTYECIFFRLGRFVLLIINVVAQLIQRDWLTWGASISLVVILQRK